MTPETVQLVASLRRPDAYPHETAAITVRETHISWVFLTGEFAYKIKKPVRFSFLDFSTLDRRRLFCEEEVRLNRRFAPELYLGVVPITGSPSAPRVGGSGPVVEYAVKMRQFEERQLLSCMIAQGQLLPEYVDQLADEVADFHALAQVVPEDSPYGSPAEVLAIALGNVDVLTNLPDVDELRVPLQDWTRAAFDELRSQFQSRRHEGFVRECHGDLHLGNIILLDGKVRMFDGIEFNDELRWIDVACDAAFTVMDLEDRGRPDLSRRFLNEYLQQTGDYAGLAVFPWYLVYRAIVRAKVAAIRACEPDVSGPDRQQAVSQCREYLELARRDTVPRSAQLFITCGVSGSGKTSGTQRLVESLGAVRVRSDVERKRLYGLKPNESSGSRVNDGLYSPKATRETYDRLADCAERIMRSGFPAVVDATFLRAADRERFHQLARELNVPFAILPFEADESTLRRRVQQRYAEARDASEATLDVLARQLATREPLAARERAFCRDVADICRPREQSCRQ